MCEHLDLKTQLREKTLFCQEFVFREKNRHSEDISTDFTDGIIIVPTQGKRLLLNRMPTNARKQ